MRKAANWPGVRLENDILKPVEANACPQKFLGVSQAASELRKRRRLRNYSAVLITGEIGNGKILANMIGAADRRTNLSSVNCGALNEV